LWWRRWRSDQHDDHAHDYIDHDIADTQHIAGRDAPGNSDERQERHSSLSAAGPVAMAVSIGHRKWRTASIIRSCTTVGLAAVDPMRSRTREFVRRSDTRSRTTTHRLRPSAVATPSVYRAGGAP
jgi:hypothetical protein